MASKSQLAKCEQLIKQHKIQVIDLKALDLVGRLHHVSLPVYKDTLKKIVKEGVGFDGSSYGFRKVENSDMILMPDLDTASIDPFREAPTLSFFSHILLTDEKRTPFNQDGRYLAKQTEALLKKVTGADKSWWGPEFEFYIFSNVEYDTRTSTSFYKVEHVEEFYKKAYHAANPFDEYDDFRDELTKLLIQQGVKVKYHHHEVGERGQQEIETFFSDLLSSGDNIVTTKYVLFNFAEQRGLHITLMPKPMYHQAGNGLHLHLYLTKKGKNIFYKKGAYANLSETGKYFIGGLLKHGQAVSALTNPSTNSYKRLVPGFEAPVALTFGQGNRASAVRIPSYITNPDETRIEYRPPDATMNPYFGMIAIMLAGIDGIVNKIDPVKEGFGPYDKNFLEDDSVDKIHFLPRNLAEAIDALEADHKFLKRGNIFSDELLEQWVKVKREEVHSIGTMPHPFEYKMYFSL
ncbi:MAG: type I glutamate--ammonia ligase [Ignavibacteria bacterium]|nr:type I glutamate--ammonia ligase [Ignavibacteria bacterium]MBT8380762.1 type I glutamate--ammonia ligase [Ignavibacteria bacterium]MBT8390279.1 type I glutamate--ammonia ligase [Ignavibacteria bacterium]NNJ53211.1 type I glutamate--ammonia ligase [Ignavibacteriaceae bacterium]NNL22320.1 type I glutamate--ammonia ligase [Ignavibacteriaceae bacterium]